MCEMNAKLDQVETMKTNEKKLSLPPIVSSAEWQAAHEQLPRNEKAATRARDALAAERRRLPMVQIDKEYVFEGPNGKARLADLFVGRRPLLISPSLSSPVLSR